MAYYGHTYATSEDSRTFIALIVAYLAALYPIRERTYYYAWKSAPNASSDMAFSLRERARRYDITNTQDIVLLLGDLITKIQAVIRSLLAPMSNCMLVLYCQTFFALFAVESVYEQSNQHNGAWLRALHFKVAINMLPEPKSFCVWNVLLLDNTTYPYTHL